MHLHQVVGLRGELRNIAAAAARLAAVWWPCGLRELNPTRNESQGVQRRRSVQAESASTSSVSLFFSFPKTTHDGIVAGTLVLADEAAVLPRQHPDKVGGHLGKFRVWSDVVKAGTTKRKWRCMDREERG